MEKRDLSRTYLAVSKKSSEILGYVTLGIKCIIIPKEKLLSNNYLKKMNVDKKGIAQSYLLGQLARSKQSTAGFGDELIKFAIKKFQEAKKCVGCRMVRLDCMGDLVEYYQKRGFHRICENKSGDLNQMMILIG